MHVYYVPDMNCKHCQKVITEALQAAGITDFTVDLENKKVTAPGDTSKILGILENAGYSPKEATV